MSSARTTESISPSSPPSQGARHQGRKSRALIESRANTRLGGWWDRKGENEIDIVAENELDGKATFYEVKRKAGNIDLDVLRIKADAFLRATGEFKNYDISYNGLSMNDM